MIRNTCPVAIRRVTRRLGKAVAWVAAVTSIAGLVACGTAGSGKTGANSGTSSRRGASAPRTPAGPVPLARQCEVTSPLLAGVYGLDPAATTSDCDNNAFQDYGYVDVWHELGNAQWGAIASVWSPVTAPAFGAMAKSMTQFKLDGVYPAAFQPGQDLVIAKIGGIVTQFQLQTGDGGVIPGSQQDLVRAAGLILPRIALRWNPA